MEGTLAGSYKIENYVIIWIIKIKGAEGIYCKNILNTYSIIHACTIGVFILFLVVWIS